MNPWTTLLFIIVAVPVFLTVIILSAATFGAIRSGLRKSKTKQPTGALITALAELPDFEVLDTDGHPVKVVARKQLMDALQTWRKENR